MYPLRKNPDAEAVQPDNDEFRKDEKIIFDEDDEVVLEAPQRHYRESRDLKGKTGSKVKLKGIKKYIVEGWEMYVRNIWQYLLYSAVFFAISILVMFPLEVVLAGMFSNMLFIPDAIAKAFSVLIGVVFLVVPLQAGYVVFALQEARGEQPEIENFFESFRYYLPLCLNALVKGLVVAAGLLLLVLPGIYLMVAYTFDTFLIIDKEMGFWDAMKRSRLIVKKHLREIFVLDLFSFLFISPVILYAVFMLLGSSVLMVTAPCIAAFVAQFSIGMLLSAYRDIVGLEYE